MNNDDRKTLLDIYMMEYQKLKDEQVARIGFRDNLIYATLVAIGAILSFALADVANARALLILPLATFVLGWTYLVNDEKISALARYIRTDLTNRMRLLSPELQTTILNWERNSAQDKRRLRRKILQFVINESLFVGAGVAAMLAYFSSGAAVSPLALWVATLESIFLIVLAIEIVVYAEFKAKI